MLDGLEVELHEVGDGLGGQQEPGLLLPHLGEVVQEPEELRQVLEVRLGLARLQEAEEGADVPGHGAAGADLAAEGLGRLLVGVLALPGKQVALLLRTPKKMVSF